MISEIKVERIRNVRTPARTAATIVTVAILIGIGWLGAIISQSTKPTLADIKTIAETINNFVLATSVAVGGIWAYYKFVRGRLFAPKIDMGFSHTIVHVNRSHLLVYLEVTTKNIGSTRVLPESFYIRVTGLQVSNGKVLQETIRVDNLSEGISTNGLWYIEPGETDCRTAVFVVEQSHHAVSVEATIEYAHNNQTHRNYFIRLHE